MNTLEFRAALAVLGMSYRELAQRAHVDERSVKRWASPISPYDVPDGIVADVIEPELKRQEQAVETAIEIVEDKADDFDEPHEVRLPWYVGNGKEVAYLADGRTYDMANADSLRVWSALKSLGYNAIFVAPNETGVNQCSQKM